MTLKVISKNQLRKRPVQGLFYFMKNKEIQIQNTESYGAHCNCHRGVSDYNDGGSYWHWGGNDDYRSNNQENARDEDLSGQVAWGNMNGRKKSTSSNPHSSL